MAQKNPQLFNQCQLELAKKVLNSKVKFISSLIYGISLSDAKKIVSQR